MRSWLLSALLAMSVAIPASATQQADAPKNREKQDAKQTEQAVKKARKHANKADELPHDQARKADEEGRKANKKAQKKTGVAGTSGAANRFHALDTNGNGIIERTEWRGDDPSFASEDWNRDGVLSGNEVRPGAKRPGKG